jgi:hypothetical protein
MSIGGVNGFGVEVRRNTNNYHIGNSSMWFDDNSRSRRRDSNDSSILDGASSTLADS